MTATHRWLIVGLGNPGKQYEATRHNIGFMLIHHLAAKLGTTGKSEGRFKAIVASGVLAGKPVILAQPTTYMNLSGQAVSSLMHYYKVPPEQLLVIYDDIALPFGKLRVRGKGSAGGQKGMKSIIQSLGGNEDFPRLRLGIDAPEGKVPLHAHVLSKFSPEEQAALANNILPVAADAVEMILDQGVEAAMNRYNGLDLTTASS